MKRIAIILLITMITGMGAALGAAAACDSCQGSGYCHLCEGSGKVTNGATCILCEGSGKCSICGGSGKF